ncbi:hypothetical protein CHELA20_53827 [Hyphomicrobiales bacterium]|nr:hypothetical protein CHELA41_21100 [Hyphomicrobiales bacterium]CAH1685028.1 hypothetical protein CHELA20_53827 [Hyphomicrobiales bacterium]
MTPKFRVERAAAPGAATRPETAGVAGRKQNGLRGSVSRRDWCFRKPDGDRSQNSILAGGR